MVEISPSLKKAYWLFAGLGGIWAIFLTSLTQPWLQRHALYAHKLHSAWWQDLNKPEQWGYLKNQIRPFNITTPDGERLYAWHVLPLAVYRKHETELLSEPSDISDVTQSVAYRLLAKDPESRVVVNFHGNAGHIGQGWRTDGYRALSAGSSKIHVIAFDYRGFGYSTGFPTEQGLITDGIAAVDWVLTKANIPPRRMAIVGQSLGTAVGTAVAEYFATVRGIEFAGVALVAAFSDLTKLLATYSIGRVIPIFSPLQPYPKIQRFFESKIIDKWETDRRLESLVRTSNHVNVILLHAKDDYDIHWMHSDTLFFAAANATSEQGMTLPMMQGVAKQVEIGEEGWTRSWAAGVSDGGVKRIKQILLKHGGHNRVLTYPPVSKAVLDALNLSG